MATTSKTVTKKTTERLKTLKMNFGTTYQETYLIKISLHLPPLPTPETKRSKLHSVTFLLQWLLYFLLIWQSVCHVSDNGLAWLLKFLFQFFRALNIHVSDSIFEELIAVFPTSLYMLRQFLKIDRDDFTKYVVCPKCYKCYEYGECLVHRNGQYFAKRCSNKLYSREKSYICNSQLVKKVTLKNNVTKFYPLHYYCYNSIINTLEKMVKKLDLSKSVNNGD